MVDPHAGHGGHERDVRGGNHGGEHDDGRGRCAGPGDQGDSGHLLG